VCCTLSAHTEFTNYCCRLLISLEFSFKACDMSASYRNTGFKAFMPLFESFINFVKKNCEKFEKKTKYIYITFF